MNVIEHPSNRHKLEECLSEKSKERLLEVAHQLRESRREQEINQAYQRREQREAS